MRLQLAYMTEYHIVYEVLTYRPVGCGELDKEYDNQEHPHIGWHQ